MMSAIKSIQVEIIPYNFEYHDTLLSLARAFLLSDGTEKIAMARAMLELMT